MDRLIVETARAIFPSVRLVPGDDSVMVLSSQDNLNSIGADEIADRLKQAGLNLQFVTEQFLHYRLDPEKEEWFSKSLSEEGQPEINRDFKPSGAFLAVSYWASMFLNGAPQWFSFMHGFKFRYVWLVLAGLAVLLLAAQRKFETIAMPAVLAATGFSGMGFTVMLFFSYQICFGILYNKLGFFLSMFLFGLSAGAFASHRMVRDYPKLKGRAFLFAEVSLIVFSFFLPELLRFHQSEILFTALFLTAGAFAGLEFPLASAYFRASSAGERAGILYGADLLGGFLAASLFSVWFLPVYGLGKCAMLILGVKCASLILLLLYFYRLQKRQYVA